MNYHFALSVPQLRLLAATFKCTDENGLPVMAREHRTAEVLAYLKLVERSYPSAFGRLKLTAAGRAEIANRPATMSLYL